VYFKGDRKPLYEGSKAGPIFPLGRGIFERGKALRSEDNNILGR
jgi:hypothetical protein